MYCSTDERAGAANNQRHDQDTARPHHDEAHERVVSGGKPDVGDAERALKHEQQLQAEVPSWEDECNMRWEGPAESTGSR
jgi:hypothetical protein